MQRTVQIAVITRLEQEQSKADIEIVRKKGEVLSRERAKSLERMERRKYERVRVTASVVGVGQQTETHAEEV